MAFPFAALIPVVGKVLDKVFPDPKAAAEAKLKVLELQQQGELAELDADVQLAVGQLQVNKEEAKHGSIFVAGWRPFAGWVCGVALGYNFILKPLSEFVAVVSGVSAHTIALIPTIEIGALMTVLLGMLGLGGMRSYEKRNLVARGALKE